MTTNDIPIRQNSPEFIELLKASSIAYGRVKKIANVQTWLAVCTAILAPFISFMWPELKDWVAIGALLTLIADVVFLERAAETNQVLGAKIQEEFDTRLFQLPWNGVRVQGHPDHGEIVGLASHGEVDSKLHNLIDWYAPCVGKVPIEYARLICQRANMRWDAKLRRNYSLTFVGILIAILAIGLILGLWLGWGLDNFAISLILPALPLANKIWREYRKHTKSAEASERAREILDRLWDNSLQGLKSNAEMLDGSRQLQDELYDRRRQSPTIPEWWYNLFRGKQEIEMVGGSEKLVETVINALSNRT